MFSLPQIAYARRRLDDLPRRSPFILPSAPGTTFTEGCRSVSKAMLAAAFTDCTLAHEREEWKQEADNRRRSLSVLTCRKTSRSSGRKLVGRVMPTFGSRDRVSVY